MSRTAEPRSDVAARLLAATAVVLATLSVTACASSDGIGLRDEGTATPAGIRPVSEPRESGDAPAPTHRTRPDPHPGHPAHLPDQHTHQ
ncbi:hypothetical protein ABZ791_14275 [Streptomyces huasconensis]|uniref:Lipoprotein n=1 Tax=Streptomyces huasconensis TaxID=1854574 RepID=A0ABV3LPC8_9ACTN